jgi:hypothetical protein
MPDFRMGPWHDLVNEDFATIDELLFSLYQGVDTQVWTNNTGFTAGDTAIDATDSSYWVCSVSHTSAPTGTFAADRAAHPTYWNRVVTGMAPRGEWTHDTHYLPNDLVTSSPDGIIALCKVDHTSNHSGTIVTDSANWSFLVDLATVLAASSVTYNNVTSGGPSTNTQGTLDDLYAKIAALPASYVLKTGSTMSGPLILSANPTVPLGAATKAYVDSVVLGGGISDAPSDGNTYGRNNAAWVVVSAGGGGISDAPSDGTPYVRQSLGWVSEFDATLPSMDGAASAGGSVKSARIDHVHPTDTTRAPLASPTFTGVPAAPTASPGTNTTQIATTAYADAIAALKANLANPVFTGDPQAPTPLTADNDTSIATTAFVKAQGYATSASVSATYAPLASPTFTGDPKAPTAAVDDNDTSVATTAYVIGQASASGDGTPAMDGTASRGTAIHWARADHIHPTDTTRAPLNNPVFTGDPQVPTASAGDNDTSIASTAFVNTAIANTKEISITFIVDGGGSAISTGIKGDLEIPFACTITRWTLLADQSGSIQFDIWKNVYASYPPTVANTITASAKPIISSALKGQSSTLTGWTTSVAAGDTLRFNVDSASAITRCTISLKATKS